MTYRATLGPGSDRVPALAPHDSGQAEGGMFVNKGLPWRRGSRGFGTDRCAVLAFHLQVAALSLKPGASLTCHLSDRSAFLRVLARSGTRGAIGGRAEQLGAASKQARQEK